ncbi:MAG: hypothetical protein WCS95_01300 [Lentisphaeria bacterium]
MPNVNLLVLILCIMCLNFSSFALGLGFKLEQFEERTQSVILENDFVRIRINERGGRISQFYLKEADYDFCSDDGSVFSGLGKIRDVYYNNIETLTGRHRLELESSSPERLTVKATYLAHSGNLAGLEISRSYTLREDSTFLDCRILLKCLEQESELQINLHSLFPIDPENNEVYHFIPSKRGLASFSQNQALLQKMNLCMDPAQPWCAFIDRKKLCGMALLAKNLEQLEGMFVWASANNFTLELNFNNLKLRPVAAADEWEAEFRLAPLQGLSQINQLGNSGAFSWQSDGALLEAKFMAFTSGSANFRVRQAAHTLAEDRFDMQKPNQVASLQWESGRQAEEYHLEWDAQSYVSTATMSLKKEQVESPSLLQSLPKKELHGPSGFYYYYPELWLSQEGQTSLAFGLRGDFRKHQDLRFAIDLPPGVQLPYSRAEILAESELELEGKPYHRVEIQSFRKNSYTNAVMLNLLLDSKFEEGSRLFIQALWKDGSQEPLAIKLRQAPQLLEIGSGLRHFKIGIHDDLPSDSWPPFSRIGINVFMLSSWDAPLMLYDYKGKGYLQKQVDDIKAAGLFPIYGYPSPYNHIGRVLQKMEPYYGGAGTLFHPEKSYQPLDLEQARAVNIHGKKVNMPCPSFHGPLLAKAEDALKSVLDYGFEHMCYDEEMWSSGSTVCYCEKCQKGFADYLRAHSPSLAYVDPAQATLNPDKYPRQLDAWWEYKTDMVAEIYRSLRRVIDTYENKGGEKRQVWVWVDCSVGEGRYGAITQRLTDYAKLGRYVDLLLPMVYSANAEDVAKVIANGRKALEGSNAHIAAGLSPNRSYEYHRVLSGNLAPEDAMRQQLLESFFNGAQAAVVWSWKAALRGALDYHKINQAVYMLLPVEDILYKGELVEGLVECDNPEIKLSVWRYQDKLAVFLRNYEPETLRARLKLPQFYSKLTDTLSRESFSASNNLELVFQKDRVKVFLVE